MNNGVHTISITFNEFVESKVQNIVMPGANCAIHGCGTTRRSNFTGISLFGLPPNNTEDSKKIKWQAETAKHNNKVQSGR